MDGHKKISLRTLLRFLNYVSRPIFPYFLFATFFFFCLFVSILSFQSSSFQYTQVCFNTGKYHLGKKWKGFILLISHNEVWVFLSQDCETKHCVCCCKYQLAERLHLLVSVLHRQEKDVSWYWRIVMLRLFIQFP